LRRQRLTPCYSVRFSRRCIVGLVISLALAFATLDGHVVAQHAATRIDRQVIRETVESVAAVVNREYFDAGVGARVEASLRQWLSQGRYADADTLESLAGMLTRDLLATTRDKHLAVTVVPDASPGRAPDQASAASKK
jgi:hypothetical protein